MAIIPLPREQFLLKYREIGGKKPTWKVKYLLRGFTDMKDIYVNENAIFLNEKDKDLHIAYLQGHIEGKEHTLFGVMSPYPLIRLTTTNIEEIQKAARIVNQQLKGTPNEELGRAVDQEVQTWIIGDQEQMTQNMKNLILTLKAKIPSYPANKPIHDLIGSLEKEKDLTKQYTLM